MIYRFRWEPINLKRTLTIKLAGATKKAEVLKISEIKIPSDECLKAYTGLKRNSDNPWHNK